jgi:hypothetical protein
MPGSALLTDTISLRKNCKRRATVDSVVNAMAAGFYPLIKVSVGRALHIVALD